MSGFLSLIVGVPLLPGLFGAVESVLPPQTPTNAFESVEIGVAELSPAGERGGYAVPASGSSIACTLTITPNPSTVGQDVTLTWTDGVNDMRVERNGTRICTTCDSGWVDDSADALAAGSYTYTVSATVSGDCLQWDDKGIYCLHPAENVYSCSATLTVAAAAAPDLVPTAPTVSGTGSTRTFSGTVTNNGSTGAGAFQNVFQVDLNRDGTVDATVTGTSLGVLYGGETRALTSSSWTAVPGDHRVRLVVDSGSAVAESNEANNTSAWTDFSIVILPDLTTSNVVVNTGSLTVNTPLTFNGTVLSSNAGTGAGFSDRFRYRVQTGTFLGVPIWSSWTTFSTVAQAALASGGSAQNTSASVQFASASNIQIEFCADSGAVITESNESNNCTTQQFTIAAAPAAPTVTSCTASPNPSTTGQSVTWTANVTGGTAPLSYSWTGTDGLGGTYAINTVSHTYNSAGTKNATVNVTDNLGQSSGAYACTALTVNAPSTPTVDLGIREIGTGSFGGSVTVDAGDNVELQWSSSNADRCVGDSYFSTGSGQPTSGTQQTVSEPASGARVYTVTCYDDDAGTQASDTATVNVNAPSGNPSVSGSPSRVQQGDTGTLEFDTGGHTNCVITGTNGDSFDLTALYPGQQTGTIITGPINGETVYTMQCDLASTQTTLRIFPVFEEI